MNNLSWFLYFADVLPGILTPFITIFGIASAIWLLVNIVCYFGFMSDYNDRGRDKDKVQYESAGARLKSWITYVLIGLFCFTLLSGRLIPSRDTFYLIAGSELGEQVVKTPEAREIFDDIRKVIKQQINDQAEKVK